MRQTIFSETPKVSDNFGISKKKYRKLIKLQPHSYLTCKIDQSLLKILKKSFKHFIKPINFSLNSKSGKNFQILKK